MKTESSEIYSIYEVLTYGPILCSDEDNGILITVNGAYFNFWVEVSPGLYRNFDCASPGVTDDDKREFWSVQLLAEEKLVNKVDELVKELES